VHEINKADEVHVGKHLSDSFPIKNGIKQGDVLSPLLFSIALEYATKKVKRIWWD
jgi:retron-type reverse transcriptase